MQKYVVLGLIAAGTAAFAHSGVKDPDVMNRMMGMSAMSKQLEVIGDMAKGNTAFDASAANAALATISEEASYVPSLFENGAKDPKSEAKDVIWSEFDKFIVLANELQTTAADLAGTVGDKAHLGPVLQQISRACSACHKDYRLD